MPQSRVYVLVPHNVLTNATGALSYGESPNVPQYRTRRNAWRNDHIITASATVTFAVFYQPCINHSSRAFAPRVRCHLRLSNGTSRVFVPQGPRGPSRAHYPYHSLAQVFSRRSLDTRMAHRHSSCINDMYWSGVQLSPSDVHDVDPFLDQGQLSEDGVEGGQGGEAPCCCVLP